ncbi:phenylalanine--tRNA ligase subunit alpha [Thermodesulfovibrionales bacterium]|nr:phenylalanine--tRNA ligase subunit alpha [Thermodesulfovibrionales bacterium]MCL0035318.1 phenylalanine--tRNA ligase subunit alpha [Thermodesulfovibrionales bacterium]MCL0036917.1 phenylalanine--tRNA ligase subunit alpha [Thermodesulfovibrionales bacterium]MCL0042191.1 phenylalanine--tRNA ligase subunit alpha [Thermodesulfovibrionales bacterium]MCL0068394.1 phenylalanine--tRNA ligase subunit alpha [Thermodesulfovibrionales bacterium]
MTKDLKRVFLEELRSVKSMTDLSHLRVKYLGRKGIITLELRSLSSISPADRPAAGKKITSIKQFIEAEFAVVESILKREELQRELQANCIDVTLSGKFVPFGRQHPISRMLSEITDIFVTMGFGIEEGPEVESDYYNFESLNIPKDHPARDMQDTFYINDDMVLRTHTSPVQVRVMEKARPPLMIIVPGKVYRRDADITHTPMFHQIEGLMVDRGITFSNLKGVLEAFLYHLFGPDTPVRFRPSFFPFTEPSAEVDIGCILCGGDGCNVCKGSGWVEILGAGMVNPVVFENVGYDTEEFSGFAFGMGVERIAMLKYSIDDIRLFFENDIRFLRQF